MISEELKNLVSRFGTMIIIENNKPKFVVMSYDAIKDLVIPVASSSGVIHKNIDNSANFDKDNKDSNEEIMDRLNKEILALKEQVVERERDLITRE